MRNRLILFVLLAVGLALPTSAVAAPAYEPNDGIHQAYGPLASGTDYDAKISTSSDSDWYIFYINAAGDLDVKLTNVDDSSDCWTDFALKDEFGDTLNYTDVREASSETLEYTTPGPGTYYVWVGDSCGVDEYTLSLTGPIGDGPRPGASEPTPNNNPDMDSAYGPLLGGTLYGGRLDVYDEEDWFYFHASGAGTFDLALTNIPDDSDSWTDLNLYDDSGEYLNGIDVAENRIRHIEYTTAGPETFYLRVYDSSPGDEYQFEINPASMVTTTPPPAPTPDPTPDPPGADDGDEISDKCAKAQRKVQKAKKQKRQAKKKIKQAKKNGKSKRKVSKLKKKFTKKKKKQLKSKKKKRNAACT